MNERKQRKTIIDFIGKRKPSIKNTRPSRQNENLQIQAYQRAHKRDTGYKSEVQQPGSRVSHGI